MHVNFEFVCVFIAQYANEQMEGVQGQGQHILAVCKAFVKLNLMVELYKK
jgi:hypothetical protein